MNILKKIFEIKNVDETRKQITILGFKIKIKRKSSKSNPIEENLIRLTNKQTVLLRELNRIEQTNLSTARIHAETFPRFKNCHNGEKIVIVASGPTAKYYEPIKEAIHISVNRSFLLDNIDFKYAFIQDYSGPTQSYIEDLVNYKPDTCQKFFGLTAEYNTQKNRVIPESVAIRAKALRYRTDWAKISNFEPKFAYDISSQPLGCFRTIVFPALQFALWTNPKEIYLVGCDCTTSGYFNSKEGSPEFKPDIIIESYKIFKHFAHVYYPETKIISINPVGLKEIFDEDIYTDEYLSIEKNKG